jgi:hypothetical protein
MNNLFKGTLVAGAMLVGSSAFAQIQDEKNVTVTMELVPILQLNMNTPDQVNFVFDEISEYLGGITQYGATILTASSTISFDLFASGTSGKHQTAASDFHWDDQVAYGSGTGTDSIPLRALELRQFPADINNGQAATDGDYIAVFAPATGAPAFANNIYVSATTSPYVAPPGGTGEDRYIAGGDGTLSFVAGGSYLTSGSVAANGALNAYYFVIDYRIVPGLPAIFPFASDGAGAAGDIATVGTVTAGNQFGRPGVYTMNVKYLMIENQ